MLHWKISKGSFQYFNRTFERPLGLTELGFYWDGNFNGTADIIQHTIVAIEDPRLVGVHNVTRTWIALKRQFPMLGSYISDNRRGKDGVTFVVEEDRLGVCSPDEIKFQVISSLQEAQGFVNKVVNGKRSLSNALLARLFILTRTDDKSHVHVLIHIAHCITDGMANTSLLKHFLDILSSPSSHQSWIIEERLALAMASEDLVPKINNKARQRWYRAIGCILASLRTEQITGGHTLPRRITRQTLHTPARSATIMTSFSTRDSAFIMHHCRKYGITFGNALPVLSQVALTRVLCRLFVSGHISDSEWEYRKREPMTTGGPLNLRPYLNQEWFGRGGFENVSLAISFFFHTLPFMPLGSATGIRPGDPVPAFGHLLTQGRFLLRCNMIKQQAQRSVQHPRFLEILGARAQTRVNRLKGATMQWKSSGHSVLDLRNISVKDQGIVHGPVLSHGGSSLGNIDSFLPRDYPILRGTRDLRKLHLVSSHTTLHCRPGELYLGAATASQQLHLSVYWDVNTYEEVTVSEWLKEIKAAIQFYLVSNGSGDSTWEAQARL
ncbi:hypothetical protein BDZ94DRAFT_1255858 [Collybia nuda]|uniref:Condensation domain-containing protein n=1 Tax=Collybia nuda TaxID=64659 RepID=A0A9P5Y9T2_9AGAR|nr:hypothetical protein BDZ94DRAFT_1255858 [Collybia nuda]